MTTLQLEPQIETQLKLSSPWEELKAQTPRQIVHCKSVYSKITRWKFCSKIASKDLRPRYHSANEKLQMCIREKWIWPPSLLLKKTQKQKSSWAATSLTWKSCLKDPWLQRIQISESTRCKRHHQLKQASRTWLKRTTTMKMSMKMTTLNKLTLLMISPPRMSKMEWLIQIHHLRFTQGKLFIILRIKCRLLQHLRMTEWFKGSERMRMKMTRMTIIQMTMTLLTKREKALSNNKMWMQVKLKTHSINQNSQLSRKQLMNINLIGVRNCHLKTPNSSNSQVWGQFREAICHKGHKRPIKETLWESLSAPQTSKESLRDSPASSTGQLPKYLMSSSQWPQRSRSRDLNLVQLSCLKKKLQKSLSTTEEL